MSKIGGRSEETDSAGEARDLRLEWPITGLLQETNVLLEASESNGNMNFRGSTSLFTREGFLGLKVELLSWD